MDFNTNHDENEYYQAPGQLAPVPPVITPNPLAIASMILGIASIILICTVYGSACTAGLAIILAVLSRGYHASQNLQSEDMPSVVVPTMHAYAKAGIVTAAVSLSFLGIVLATVITLLAASPDYRNAVIDSYNDAYEYYYDSDYYYEYESEPERSLPYEDRRIF